MRFINYVNNLKEFSKMNKTDLLFQMMERPQAYTAQQWQEILSDEECRELYTLMAKTQSAFDVQRDIDDETIDEEWKKLSNASDRRWLRVAAMFVGVLMLSGIAIAAIWSLSPSPSPKGEEIEYAQVSDTMKPHPQPLPTGREAGGEASVVFDNVTLEKMLPEIAAHYNKEVEFQNEEARQLRFYFVWKQDDSLHEVVEKLNMFEHVNMTVEDNKLIVR